MTDIPVLETDRLIPRAPTLNDLDAYTAFRGNDRSVALAKRMGVTYEGDYLLSDAGPLEIYCHLSPEALS